MRESRGILALTVIAYLQKFREEFPYLDCGEDAIGTLLITARDEVLSTPFNVD